MQLRLVERLICRVPMWYRALFPGATWRIPAKEGKSIYLTFDDGPIPEITPWVLDTLDELGVKATFFCVADNVRRYPDLFAEIQRRGHQVGNHTFHHLQGLKVRTRTYLKDVEEADRLINSRFFRPPHGHLRFMQTLLLSNHYDIIMRPLHGNWPAFYLLIHCIIGSYFVYLSIKNSIIFLPWHTNPRIPMSM
ncbi:polysaccharide deacetylase family protein [Porphyromonas gingivalis]|uniref:polysaccharide deacetylase family protein n=1 Tax=Porphyromonas gingivalis TaxID=837 RepID=UPI0024809587|nr:polysaccharide deacetylase family protein [Porphyromonas gingivalis]MDH7903685.1 polysaccharide deacetylase family protein [Porphyromonas gingivalis]